MVTEFIFDSFVSQMISDIADISKEKIKNAVKNRNNKHQSLESQIYNVTVDVLNEITSNQYKKEQDKVYDAAQALLMNFKNREFDHVKFIELYLQAFNLCNKDSYVEFKSLLYQKLSKDDYRELKNEIDLWWKDQENRKTSKIEQEIIKVNQKLDDVRNEHEKTNLIQDSDKKFQNNKKQEYIDNWNSRLFLHQDYDERPLTLADTFIMPNYKILKGVQKIDFSSNDTFDQTIEKFVEYKNTSTMLITGVPGIGKTSIVSWMANKYQEDDRIIILRFRDWESEELSSGLLKAICNTFECRKTDLECKILIIDGFDEIKALDSGKKLMNQFFYDMKDFRNFKCVITSRPAYIENVSFQNVLLFERFDIDKVETFYKEITGNQLEEKEKIKTNLDVLGIPVILYMAIMSEVDINENPTKPELYHRIFSEMGGIFDKFCVEGIGYDNGKQVLRYPENIKTYLKFLCETAFRMFEKNDLSLSRKEVKIPELECEGKKISVLEFPIKHLFEAAEINLEFIHKSIYEYFVSEYIYMKILEGIDDTSENMVAGVLGELFKSNKLPEEIMEFLKYNIINYKLKDKFEIISKVFQLMLHDGMMYYTNQCYKNMINCEMNVFANMLEILHLWENGFLKFDDSIYKYLHYSFNIHLNLEGVDLRNADLRKVDLNSADLKGADLRSAILIDADLNRADLKGADLSRTIFDESQVSYLKHKYNLQNALVYIKKIDGAISYQEYCNRKES